MRQLLFGALAGLTATTVMTMVMRRIHALLPPEERYPLPPREITERSLPASSERDLAELTVLGHFGYGALAGAAYSHRRLRGAGGAVFGVAVWGVSYLGWIPAAGILIPASRHPPQRNGLMLAAHLAWGATLAAALREIEASAEDVFAGGPLQDAPSGSRGRGQRP